MHLIESRGGFLYEHRPDLFPQGFLTDAELALWAVHYERKAAEAKHRG
jgi:hypothetical protein